MNINLFANNTIFGMPYTSPPGEFTAGAGFKNELYSFGRLIKSIPVPEKTAYFVNPIISWNSHRGGNLVGDFDFERTIRLIDTEMIHLNPELRFMPAKIFSRGESIPLKSLANRNVAVVASDNKYQTLGEVGEQSRRQSFYHANTPVHPELCDERIAEFAQLGFFRMHEGYGVYTTFGCWVRQPVFNINFCSYFDMSFKCFELSISNGQIPEHKRDRLINHDLLQCPIIETKYQGIIDRAVNVGQSTHENEGAVKSLREAEFFMAPYQKAIRFCQSVIGALSTYPQEHPKLSVAINRAISRLAFSEHYMRDSSGLVRQAIVYDELMELENTKELKFKQEENRKQLIQKEVEWHKEAVQQEILPGKDSHFPMINLYSLIMTSLGNLLMEMGYRNSWGENALREKIVDWKAAAETICIQTDELLFDRKTMHSLKLKSIWVAIESTDAENDIENPW